ncbi:MAG: FtsQ-type POTRA domain-containing protein [Gammaproteobacteria bacterium]|nr:FtsQ-type POTRA domain-containing protein [Gammaproteobacteria bacterium]
MFRKQNRRRRERTETRAFEISWPLVVAGASALVIGAGLYAAAVWVLNRPIDSIVISGSFERVSPLRLEALIEPHARAGFLEVDLGATQRSLKSQAWVASAEVRRKWPGTLVVNVREQKAVACWGEHGLLNAAGELFLPSAERVPAELPRLSGPPGTEGLVTGRYFAIQKQLEHRGLAAAAVSLDERGAWTLTLANGLLIRIGSNSVEQRIERFFKVLDGTLANLSGEVDYVDMRYPNGFAVGWKNQSDVRAAQMEEVDPDA